MIGIIIISIYWNSMNSYPRKGKIMIRIGNRVQCTRHPYEKTKPMIWICFIIVQISPIKGFVKQNIIPCYQNQWGVSHPTTAC